MGVKRKKDGGKNPANARPDRQRRRCPNVRDYDWLISDGLDEYWDSLDPKAKEWLTSYVALMTGHRSRIETTELLEMYDENHELRREVLRAQSRRRRNSIGEWRKRTLKEEEILNEAWSEDAVAELIDLKRKLDAGGDS